MFVQVYCYSLARNFFIHFFHFDLYLTISGISF